MMLTTSQTLIVVATMSAVRPAAVPFVDRVALRKDHGASLPKPGASKPHRGRGANQGCQPFGASFARRTYPANGSQNVDG